MSHEHRHHSRHSDRRAQNQSISHPICASVSEIPGLPYPVEYPSRGWCRQRVHVIDIQLGELRIFTEAPELIPAWYQTTEYYVSFHPTSDPIESLRFPAEFPEKIEIGKHLVSKPVCSRKSDAVDDSDASVNVLFAEEISLPMAVLQDNMAIYVWGRRQTVFQSEEVVLVGHCICCLTDFTLQGTAAAWSVLDSSAGCEIAELTMDFAILTTPGPVRNPATIDVSFSQATLKWTPPLNAFGSAVTSYKIEMLVERRKKTPKWQNICQCTGLQFVISPLMSDCPYVFKVSAVNQVGVGDPCEFHFITPPMPSEFSHHRHVHRARNEKLDSSHSRSHYFHTINPP